MKKRRVWILVFIGVAVILAAGFRTSIGQGFSDPVVRAPAGKADAVVSQRTLEVHLTNRKTGRPQHYQWSLSIPPSGSVEVECHEWTHFRLFGWQMFGAPKNSFRRTIPLDAAESGVAEPYDHVVRWRTKKA